jgi:hypothetical protein
VSRTRSYASTFLIGLSRLRVISVTYFMQSGSNTSFFFMSVQAMTSIFAASFTRIFVPIPFSLSLPLSLLVK